MDLITTLPFPPQLKIITNISLVAGVTLDEHRVLLMIEAYITEVRYVGVVYM